MEYRLSLSETLEKIIKIKYINTRKFAEKSGVPYMTIISVLKRGVENTTVHTLLKICDALDITIDDIFKRRAYDTIFDKIKNNPPETYTNDDIINDLIDSKLINITKKHYTDEQLYTIAQNYRYFASDDWLDISSDIFPNDKLIK